MKNDDVSGKAKGGKARAAKMTAEQRKESSRKAVAAKKEKALLPVSANEGKLKIGDAELDVAVLENGRLLFLKHLADHKEGVEHLKKRGRSICPLLWMLQTLKNI